MRIFRTFTGMNLVRRSLGPNGCGVKPRNRLLWGFATGPVGLVGAGQTSSGLL
jgi:hypothetical protein